MHQFSLNLRADLHGTRVRVTNVEPGLCGGNRFSNVRFHGDDARAASVYANAAARRRGHRRIGALDRNPAGACQRQQHRADAGGAVLRRTQRPPRQSARRGSPGRTPARQDQRARITPQAMRRPELPTGYER